VDRFRLEGSNAVAETLMIPLHARALEQQQPEPMVRDPLAAQLAELLDYDWRQIKLNRYDLATMLVRLREFDRFAREFLEDHPTATVVHIGCGLDSRFQRVDNGQVRWFDLDLPEVIELRQQVLPAVGREHYLGCSVFDYQWMAEVDSPSAGPFLFLAEAVLPYLDQQQVHDLFVELQRRFPGSELVTDAVTPLSARLDNLHLIYTGSAARMRWAVRDPREVEAWSPGIRLLESFYYFDRLEPRLGPLNWWRHVPAVRRGSGIFHYRMG
jgi:methyltransferase (TIGR00027 family)